MPRKPRLHQPGAVYHVILRGNAKQDVFFDAEVRRQFLAFLQEGIDSFGFAFTVTKQKRLPLSGSLFRF